MINYIDLTRRLVGKSLGASLAQNDADTLMPWAYQFANPQGRPLHDDWAAKGVPSWLQPWTRIRRMDTTFMLPMPMKLVWSSGPVEPKWMPWQETYPGGLTLEAQLRDAQAGSVAAAIGCPHEILAYDPVLPIGQSAEYAVWLDGAYRTCFYTSTSLVGRKRLHTNRGIKPDLTVTMLNNKPVGDMAWNYPEASLSWINIK